MTASLDTTALDLAGIGAGPFNLAVAAQLRGQGQSSRFFEAKRQYSWHPGLMLPGAELQTSYLKDLVTPVDPTSPYTFLAYLVAKRRFYDFLHAEQGAITRREFADYLQWVAARLDNVQMNSRVERVLDRGDLFELEVRGEKGAEKIMAKNLCVAAGKKPFIPDCCKPLLSDQCFHALEIALRQLDVRGKRVAVVGGGQTGAEVVLNLLNNHWGCPDELLWVSRRSNFLPLDETPFTNDWFTPGYVEVFRRLSGARRAQVVAEQKLASDGISPDTLKALYQCLYRLVHLEGAADRVQLLPHRELRNLSRAGSHELLLHNNLNGDNEVQRADLVILCTGLREALPQCLAPLQDRLQRDADGSLVLDDRFAASLQGAAGRRLYFLGTGRYSHGIAEPQLSLSAWRAAQVVNDLVGRQVYDTGQADNYMHWVTPGSPRIEVA